MIGRRRTPEYEAILAQEQLVFDATESIGFAMERAGVNRTQLAKLLGISQSAVTQRLDGASNMTLRTYAGMLHVLGMRAEIIPVPSNPQAPTVQQLVPSNRCSGFGGPSVASSQPMMRRVS